MWAPNAGSVSVGGRPLAPEPGGFHAARLEANAGDDYGFSLDGETPLADPCSRWQPGGLRGPSRILDTGSFEWTAAQVAVPLEQLILYELHVGTFTEAGTFDSAIPRLPELAELGITAIELMPVATFPGERGWGYDGVLTWAPHRAYGGPQGLARFVDAAHAAGLAVVLDVVYNHVGPGSQLLAAYGPYFKSAGTLWGSAVDYSKRGVREWAVQNAELWVRDYRIDGLRLDAAHTIVDDSEPHIMRELSDRVHAMRPQPLVIAEIEPGDRRPIEIWGDDAQWTDEFHHALHSLLTGEHDGYYAAYGKVADLATAFEETPPERLVICAQDHDQIGNRAFGDRLPPATRRVAAACTLFAPQVALLFQGEERGATTPFQFFSDHDDPAVAEATREGRRHDFAAFGEFADGELPDPQALETFERSKVPSGPGDVELHAFYRELIALRRTLPREVETAVDEGRRVLRVRRGGVELVADFDNLTVELRR